MEIHPADWAAIVQLKQFQAFQAGFLARTSHELRSPLSSLMSLHQLILNDLCDSPEEERDCLRQAHEAAHRLLKMLELVTQISKLEIGLDMPDFDAIHIQVLLEDLRFLTDLQAKNKNITLQIEGIEGLTNDLLSTLQVESDYRILRQVLVCLIESHLAIAAPGTIRVWYHYSVEEGWWGLNFSSTPSLTSWQEINTLFEKHFEKYCSSAPTGLEDVPEFVPDRLLEKLRSSSGTVGEIGSGFSPYFSLEHSLMMNQILLQKVKGKLLLFQTDREEPAFYLQCRLPLSRVASVSKR